MCCAQSAAISAIGWMVPISPFAASMETSRVFGRIASRTASAVTKPSLSGCRIVTSAIRFAGTRIDLCSIALVMKC